MISWIKKPLRWMYHKLREDHPSSWQVCKDYLEIDPSVILGNGSYVDVKFRPNNPGICVSIEEESQIFGALVIQRPGASIHIGKRTQIGNSMLIAADRIEIGDDVLMAWNFTIIDNDSHSPRWEERQNDVRQCAEDYRTTPEDFSRNKDWSNVKSAPIIIHDKDWIGFGASILKGVTIGEGAVVGACSVVTHDVPAYGMVAGNPARLIRNIHE